MTAALALIEQELAILDLATRRDSISVLAVRTRFRSRKSEDAAIARLLVKLEKSRHLARDTFGNFTITDEGRDRHRRDYRRYFPHG